MKIELRSLHVKGCGPLEDVTIDFTDAEGKPRPVTVIAGANGSGKTTVLELIAATLDTTRASLGMRLDQPKEFSFLNLFPNWHEDLSAQKSVEVIERSQEVRLEYDSTGVNDENQHFHCVIELKPHPPKDFSGFISEAAIPRTGHVHSIQNYGNSGFLNYRTKHFEIVDSHIQKREGLPLHETTEALGGENGPRTIPSILFFPHPRKIFPVRGTQLSDEETRYHWVYRYENAQEFQGSLDAYLCWLAFIEPERPGVFIEVTEFLDSLDFDGKKFNLKRTKLKATVTTREGHTHFLEELSAGEQNILIMLLELRRRLLPGSIVLIDEIESSLHEAYQHMLAQALLKIQRDIPFQLIVTTHSKTIAKIFGWDSVVILTDF